jgi:hypothetical protein
MNSGKLDAAEQDAKVGNNTMSVLNGAENDNENPPKLIMRVGHALIAVEKGKLDPLKFKCFTKFVVNAVKTTGSALQNSLFIDGVAFKKTLPTPDSKKSRNGVLERRRARWDNAKVLNTPTNCGMSAVG